MTTTVTVTAHCDSETTEVQITVKEPVGFDGDESTEITTIQHGESICFHAYDHREIIVKQVGKAVDAEFIDEELIVSDVTETASA